LRYRSTVKTFTRRLREAVEDGDSARSPFLLKVFLGGLMSREALIGHLERRRAQAEAELAEYRAIEERIASHEPSYYGYLTLRWGLIHEQAWIRWADEILAELRERGS
jgi:hypothetical protein